MADISRITTLDGTTYDLKDRLARQSIPLGTVDSTSTATVITATVDGLTELRHGACCLIYNRVIASASGWTLNVNGLGALPVHVAQNNGRSTTGFAVNRTNIFIYDSERIDGGCWVMGYFDLDTDTNTVGYQVRTNSSTRPVSGATYRYRLLFSSADGTMWVPANTSTSTNATAARTVNTTPIDPFGPIIYYGSTGSFAAGSNISATNIWQQIALTLGYSFNTTGTALTLTYPAPVYIKCSPQAGGSAIMQGYTQSLPSSKDGFIYIFLGTAYSATGVELRLEHPVYYHDGTGLRQWIGTEIPKSASDIGAIEAPASAEEGDILGYTANGWTSVREIDAETVNGHTVNADVPANAVFTDTTYGLATGSASGLMSSTDKAKLDSIILENANSPIIVVETASFSSLPVTITSDKITENHYLIESTLSNSSAQTGDWTVSTSNGSLTISGTISGATTVRLILGRVTSTSSTILVFDIASFSSLPVTVSDSRITANHYVLHTEVGTPTAQTDDWTVTTGTGTMSVDGSISGSTTLRVILGTAGSI